MSPRSERESLEVHCNSQTFISLITTQFLGAFNDNIFKTIVSLLVLKSVVASDGGIIYLSMTAALFFVPYIVFSELAGFFADRYSKTKIIRYTKLLEVIVMGLALISFYFQNITGLLSSVFLMGSQSALFSPAKYGIIPEMVSRGDISKANGFLEFSTFLAIILGTAVAGLITSYTSFNPGIICLLIALVGFFVSLYVPIVPQSGSNRAFSLDPVRPHIRTLLIIKERRGLWLSALGISFFWSLGSLFQLTILLYAKEDLGLNDLHISLLLAVIGLGIGIGSILAGKVSEGRVELGLVPIGSFFLLVTNILLFLFSSPLSFVYLTVCMLGLGSGFFIVPVQSYMQEYSPPTSRGSYLAASNFLSFSGMLLVSFLFWLITDYCKLPAQYLFLLMGIGTAAITWYIIKLMPEMLARCLNWITLRTVYKIKVSGTNNLPEKGGALIVCNHVTYVDAMLVLAALTRPVRFIMYRPIYNSPVIHPVARIMKAIPISGEDGKAKILETLIEARNLIEKGELVGIFAEGGLTRTGELQEFRTGLETIMEGTKAPIIPVYLGGLWGSIFSHEKGKVFWKWPKKIPYPVNIDVGTPLPSGTSAKVVQQVILEMSNK